MPIPKTYIGQRVVRTEMVGAVLYTYIEHMWRCDDGSTHTVPECRHSMGGYHVLLDPERDHKTVLLGKRRLSPEELSSSIASVDLGYVELAASVKGTRSGRWQCKHPNILNMPKPEPKQPWWKRRWYVRALVTDDDIRDAWFNPNCIITPHCRNAADISDNEDAIRAAMAKGGKQWASR